jgi:UDP-N-acetylmuramoylalanine--D-glutamate ligase
MRSGFGKIQIEDDDEDDDEDDCGTGNRRIDDEDKKKSDETIRMQTPERVTIMGLGLFGGGLGAAEYFAQKGSAVTITDLKTEAELSPSLEKLRGRPVTLRLGGHREADFTDVDLVVVNPAVPGNSRYVGLARDHGVRLATEISLFFELCPARIIGVTGSNGKTTTTTMIGKMLDDARHTVRVGGNIGRSLLPEVGSIAPDDIVVLELSSFQLEWLGDAKMSPEVAVVTNINPNHLDRHKTMANYIAAKKHIIAHQTPAGIAVLNADDKCLRRWGAAAPGRCMWCSANGPPAAANGDADCSFVKDGRIVIRQGDTETAVAPVSCLRVPGAHNLQNALAAVAACAAVSAPPESMAKGLGEFEGIEHRLEFVCERRGVRYYNDSKATTPESAMAALESFDSPIILIAGGYDKRVSFDTFAAKAAGRARAAILLGQTAGKIAAGLRQHPRDGFTWSVAETLAAAVSHAAGIARSGDIVMLSPACASFDMFVNYEQRGDQFKELVRGL